MLVEEGQLASQAHGQRRVQGRARPYESAPAAYGSLHTRRQGRSKRNRHRSGNVPTRPQSGRRSYQSMPAQISTKGKRLGLDIRQENKVTDGDGDVEKGNTSNIKNGASVRMNRMETFREFCLGSDQIMTSFHQRYARENDNAEKGIPKDVEGFPKDGIPFSRKDGKSMPIKHASMHIEDEKTDLGKYNRKPQKLTKDDKNKLLKSSDPIESDQNLKFQKLKKLVSVEGHLPEKVDEDKKVTEAYIESSADGQGAAADGQGGVASSRMTDTEIDALKQSIITAQVRERELDLEKQRQKREEIDLQLRRQGRVEKEELRVSLDRGTREIRLRGELDCGGVWEDKEVGLMALDNRYVEESDVLEDEETTLKKCVDPLHGNGKEKASREEKEEKEKEEEEKETDCCALEACQENRAVTDPSVDEVRYRSVDETDEDELPYNNVVTGEFCTTEATEHSCDFTDTLCPSADQDESCKSGLYTCGWTDNRTSAAENRTSAAENLPGACSIKSWSCVTDGDGEDEVEDEYSTEREKETAVEKDASVKGDFDIEGMAESFYLYVKSRMQQDVDNKMKEGIRLQLTEMIRTLCKDVKSMSEDRNGKEDEKPQMQVSLEEKKNNQEEKRQEAQEEGSDHTETGPNHTEVGLDHIEGEEPNEIEMKDEVESEKMSKDTDDVDKVADCIEDIDDEKKDSGNEKSARVEVLDFTDGSKKNKEIHTKKKKSGVRGKGKSDGRVPKKAMKKRGKAADFLEQWAEKMERYIKKDEEITVEFLEPPKPFLGVPKSRDFIKERSYGCHDDDEGMQQGHTAVLIKVMHCRGCRKQQGQAKVRKKRFDGIPKSRDNQRRLKMLDGSRHGRRCSGYSGSSQGGNTGGGTGGEETGSHRGRREGDGEQSSNNNNNNLPGGSGPGNHGNGGSGGDDPDSSRTQPTRDPVSTVVPEYNPKRFRKKHWDDSELDWAEFLGELMKKVTDHGGPLWELDDGRALFCVTECLTRLEEITDDMILCNACNTISSLLKHYANCVALYNDCDMCVQIFSLICIHIHRCITNDAAIFCEVKLCSNVALNYEGTDISMNLKILWFQCRKKLARTIGSDELVLSDIPEGTAIPAGKPPPKRTSRVLARKKSALADVPEQEQTTSEGNASGGDEPRQAVGGEIIYSITGFYDTAPQSNDPYHPHQGNFTSMPMGPPRFWRQQFPSLENNPVGTRGIGEVVYENKKQLVMVATWWEELRTKYREERTLAKHYREEGVILFEYKSKLKIEGLRYNIEYQWLKVSHLGNGMSGKCYLAKDFNTDFLFCVKEIHINNYEREEIELWTELEHPNIVKIYGAIRHGERLYILQELIEGGCLTEAINQQKNLGQRLSQQTALRYFQQLLQVLVYLRSKNILHEDLKADNILLHKENKSVSIKLADFGLARRCQATVPKGTKPVGTQTQWSPEKAEGVGYGFSAEVWASVCVLVHMLSGCPPWMRRFEMLKALIVVIVEKSPPLEDIPRNITDMMRDLIERGFTVCAGERPTAEKLLLHAAFRILENRENRHESVAYSILDPQMAVQNHAPENEDLKRIIKELDTKPQTPVFYPAQIPSATGTGANEGAAAAATGRESDSSKLDAKPKLNRPLSTEELLETFGLTYGSIPQSPSYRLQSKFSSIKSQQQNPTRPEKNTDPTELYNSFLSDTSKPADDTGYRPSIQLYQPDVSIHSSSENNSVQSSDTSFMEKMLPDFNQLGLSNYELFAGINTEEINKHEDDELNDDKEHFHKNFDLNEALKKLGFGNNEDEVSTSRLIPDVVRSPSTTESVPKDVSQSSEGAEDIPDVSVALETVVEVKPLFDDNVMISNDEYLFGSGSLDDLHASAARNVLNQQMGGIGTDSGGISENTRSTQFPQASPIDGTLESSLSKWPMTSRDATSVKPDMSSASNYQSGSTATPVNYARPLGVSTAPSSYYNPLGNNSYYNPLGNNSMMRPTTPGRYGGLMSMPVNPNISYQQRQGFHTNSPIQPMNQTFRGLPGMNRPMDDRNPVRGEIRNVNPIADRQTFSLQPRMQGEPLTRRPGPRSLFPVEHMDEYNTTEQYTVVYSQSQTTGQYSELAGDAEEGKVSRQSSDTPTLSPVTKPGRVNVKQDNNAINEMRKEQMMQASSPVPRVTIGTGGGDHANPGLDMTSHASRKPDLKINTNMTVPPPMTRSSTAPVFPQLQTTPNRLVHNPEFTRTTSLNQSGTRLSDGSLSSMSPHSRQQTSTPRSQFDEQEEVLGQLKDVLSQHSDPDVFAQRDFRDEEDFQRNTEFDSVDMENPAASLAQYLDPIPNVADITVLFKSSTNGAQMRMKFQPKHHDWSWKKIIEEELSRFTTTIQRDFGLRQFCLKWANDSLVDLDASLGMTNVIVYIHAAGNGEIWVVDNGNIFYQ